MYWLWSTWLLWISCLCFWWYCENSRVSIFKVRKLKCSNSFSPTWIVVLHRIDCWYSIKWTLVRENYHWGVLEVQISKNAVIGQCHRNSLFIPFCTDWNPVLSSVFFWSSWIRCFPTMGVAELLNCGLGVRRLAFGLIRLKSGRAFIVVWFSALFVVVKARCRKGVIGLAGLGFSLRVRMGTN